MELQPPSAAATPTTKGASKKKPKLTPAEKKAKRIEMRRLKAEAALTAKKQSFRAHLARELKYNKITHKRADLDWQQMSADIKLPELQTEVEAAFQHVQRILDQKNYTIERLLNDCDVANDQYKMNLQHHCERIDYLIRIYNFFLRGLRDIYHSECLSIIKDFQEESEGKKSSQESTQTFYENMLHESNSDTSKELEQSFNKFVFRQDETINLSIEYRYKLRDDAMKLMNRLFHHMIVINESMLKNSASPKRQIIYKALCKKQVLADIEFAGMEENAAKFQAKINRLQKALLNIETIQQQRISDLKHERSYFVECYWILKTKAICDIKKDDEQMKLLASSTHTTVNQLKKIKRYGELIIGMTAVCRKFQTEKEKVMPWPDEIKFDSMEYYDSLSHLKLMDLFWYKVSSAKAHNIGLKKEKAKLLREKETLKNYLKSYCHDRTTKSVTDILNINKTAMVVIPFQEASHSSQLQYIKIHKK